MAFSGSTHNRIHDFTDDENNSIDPSATRFDEEFDDISTALESRLAKDGTNSATADIPMGGFNLTGLSAGSTAGDSVRYEQLPSTASDSAEGLVELATNAETDTGTATDRVITPANLAYVLDGTGGTNQVETAAIATGAVTAAKLEAMDGTAAVGDFPVASITIPFSGNGAAVAPFGSSTYANRVAVMEVKRAGTYRLKARSVVYGISGSAVLFAYSFINGGSSNTFLNLGTVAAGDLDEATTTLTGLSAGDEIAFSVDAEAGGAYSYGTIAISISCDSLDYVNERVSQGLQYF